MYALSTHFWGLFVALLVTIGLVWLLFLLVSVYKARGKGSHAEEVVWDDTLREGNTPMPKWWYMLFLSSIFFAVIYMVAYPGLGRFAGVFNWTQDGQYEQGVLYQNSRHASLWALVESHDLAAIQSNTQLMASAENLYAVHCSTCHGESAQGQAQRFPNLPRALYTATRRNNNQTRPIVTKRATNRPQKCVLNAYMCAL